jgi:hypothetical protein
MKLFTTSLIISLSILLSSFVTLDGLAAPGSTRVSGAASLDGVSVAGETSVDVGDTVVLSPVDADGCSVTWTPIQGIELIEKMVQTNEPKDIINEDLEFIGLPISSLVFKPSTPGIIRFQATAIDWDKRKFYQVIHSVTVKGGDPKDEDDAQPIPPEPDNGVNGWVKSDYLVLVYESKAENISKELAELLNSKLWLKDIAKAGLNRPVVYDKDSDEAKTLIANAKDSGTESNVPFMAVMSSEGKWKRSMPVLFGDDLRKELGL